MVSVCMSSGSMTDGPLTSVVTTDSLPGHGRENQAVEMPAVLSNAGVTAREAEVLEALGSRLANAEIAERLYISVRTVESHVSALLRKLDEPDRRALAARALDVFGSVPPRVPPGLVAMVDGMPLVGRAGELERLVDAGRSARVAGLRRLAVVSGEAGIGKTRIAAEAAMRMHDEGALVLYGRCQQDALVPYQAFIDAVTPLDGRVSRLLAEGDDGGGAGAGAARHRRFEEVDLLLASPPTLVVLLLDDVQWIDPSGVQLLRHVLHHSDRSPLLVVATGRPEVHEPGRPMNDVLATHAAGLELIPLEGLSLPEAERLVASIASRDRERTRTAWERTGGNPFLLTELVSHAPGDSLPATARDAIVGRVAGLGPHVFETLCAAAVAGEAFRRAPLLSALRSSTDVHAALDRAFKAAVVTEDRDRPGEYRFTHAIVREALLGAISPGQRSRLHVRLADALEGLGPSSLVDAARHRHAGLAEGDAVRTLRSAIDAFDLTMDMLAFEVAASLADMALDAIEAGAGDDDARADAILRRGRAHLRAGDLEAATADCREALALANRRHLRDVGAEAVLGWADASPVWGRLPDLRAALEHALEQPPDDLDLRARLKARLAQLLYYEDAAERRTLLSAEAVEDASRSGRPEALAAVLSTGHAALWQPGDLERRTAIAHQIVTAASAAGEPELEAAGRGWLAVDLLESGARQEADAAFERHAALAAHLHQPLLLRDAELWAGMRAILDGRFGDADGHIETARELGEAAHDPSTETIYWVQRYWLTLERGDVAEMDAVVDPCTRIATDNRDVPAWRAALALLHTRRDDRPAAEAAYDMLAAERFSAIPADVVWLNAMTYLAETCAYLGDDEGARVLLDALIPHTGLVVLIDRALACKGSVDRFIGLLAAVAGDPRTADAHLGRAVEVHRALRADPLTERAGRERAALAGRRP
jgi:DNA-binding CsgD family transcriptional regulator